MEQIDGVTGVMPQQVIGPTARFSGGIHIGAAEEVGLHIHLLDFEFTLADPAVHPLVTGIEAAHVSGHCHDARIARDFGQRLRVLHIVGNRNLDQHMLAGAHHLLALCPVHLGGRGENDRIGAGNPFRKIIPPMRDAVFARDFPGARGITANQRHYLDIRNAFQRIQVLLAECALTGDTNFHHRPLFNGMTVSHFRE